MQGNHQEVAEELRHPEVTTSANRLCLNLGSRVGARAPEAIHAEAYVEATGRGQFSGGFFVKRSDRWRRVVDSEPEPCVQAYRRDIGSELVNHPTPKTANLREMLASPNASSNVTPIVPPSHLTIHNSLSIPRTEP